MNAHCFKTIFNKHLGTLVAVGEHACAQGKSASGEGARSAVLAAAILLGSLNSAFALDANALPSEHQVVSGQVQVTSNGTRMDIQQPSASPATAPAAYALIGATVFNRSPA